MVRSEAEKPGSMTSPINQVREDWDCIGEGSGMGSENLIGGMCMG